MPLPLKFVVLKGVCGFGDRLQCLLQAIWYAQVSRRHLVIDWRDSDWSHDPTSPLDTYFHVVDVPTFELHSFLALWQAEGHRSSMAPAPWTRVIDDPNYSRWIYNDIFNLPENNSIINEICNFNIPDLEADIIVYPGTGKRTWRYADLRHIRLSAWVRDSAREFARLHALSEGGYDIIHLRGGSKRWCGGAVPLKSLDSSIHERWPTLDTYLEDIWKQFQHALVDRPPLPLYLLSDRTDLVEAWIAKYDCGIPLPSLAGHLIRESGTHKLQPSDLKSDGPTLSKESHSKKSNSKKSLSKESLSKESLSKVLLSKESLNAELLRDFAIMLNARTIVNDGVSLFSKMAQGCSSAGIRLVNF
jgi:hypothetical protein